MRELLVVSLAVLAVSSVAPLQSYAQYSVGNTVRDRGGGVLGRRIQMSADDLKQFKMKNPGAVFREVPIDSSGTPVGGRGGTYSRSKSRTVNVNGREMRADDYNRAIKARHAEATAIETEGYSEVTAALKRKDTARAITVLKQMHAAGSYNAAFSIANIFIGKKDYAQAWVWLRESAKKGNPQAQGQMARLYMNGWGAPKDFGKAIAALEKAKSPWSNHWLACIYVDGPDSFRNYEKGAECLRRAVAGNYAPADESLAELSLVGLGLPQDFSLAQRLFLRSGKSESPKALFYLQQMYANGEGVTKDEAQAANYAQRLKSSLAKIKPNEDELSKILNKDSTNLPERYERLKRQAQNLHTAANKLDSPGSIVSANEPDSAGSKEDASNTPVEGH